jgi:hypothetical protein
MERVEKLELLVGLKPGPWRLSVRKELWPDFAESHPHPRVFGKVTRWIRKHDRIRVEWPDGAGTHDVDDLLDHDLQFEDGEEGEPAPDADTLRNMRTRRRATAASADDGREEDVTSSEDDSESDAEESVGPPPLQSARTKAGVTWTYEKEEIKRDSRTAHNPEPRFVCDHSTITSILILFLYLLPAVLTTEAEGYTNARIADGNQHTSVPELLMFYGYLIIVTVYDTGPFEQLWNVTGPEFDCMPPPNIGRHGLSLNRFKFLMSHWRCGPEPATTPGADKWARVRGLVDGFNKHLVEHFYPSYMLTIDESMVAWRGIDLPHLSFVPRKPEPLGVEIKTLACFTSRILIQMEFAEGKEVMCTKEYERAYGHTTATTLRLSTPWANTDRVIAGDSWFASFKCAVALMQELGLYFLGVVKTNTAGFPNSALDRCSKEKGSWITYSHVVDSIRVLAVAHRKGRGKLNKFVATCFTTDKGARNEYKYTEGRGAGRSSYVEGWDAPKMANRWTEAQPAIDAFNRQRQHDFGMEKRFRTTDWATRFQMHVLASVIINTINGWTRVLNHTGTLRSLLVDLGMALIVRGRTDLREHRERQGSGLGRPPMWAATSTPAPTTPAPGFARAGPISASARTGTLRPSPIAARDVTVRQIRHEPVLYTTRGYKAGTQRLCTVCKRHTSTFCSACGMDCPIHAPLSRKGEAYTCLDTHLNDPDFRTSRKKPRGS